MPFRHISVLDRELARGIWIEFDSMGIDTDRKMHGAFAKTRVTDGEYTSAAATRSICVTLRVSRRFSRARRRLCRCALPKAFLARRKSLRKETYESVPSSAILDALEMTGKVRSNRLL